MSTDWEIFQNAYQAASKEVRSFVDSTEISDFLDKKILLNIMPASSKPDMLVSISDLCLGVTTKNELGASMIKAGVTFENSHTLYSEVLSFLESKGFQFSSQKNLTALDTNLASEISAAEHDLASLHSVRTMSHDMAAIKPGSDVIYQSSQADILRTPTLPTPPPAETPRWETSDPT